jgi:DNA polymerase family A
LSLKQHLKNHIFIDIESYYATKDRYSLRCMTTPEYILDPRFKFHLVGVQDLLKPDEPKIFTSEEFAERLITDYPAEETEAGSHNALFDLSAIAWKLGWVPARMFDTLGMARSLLRLPRYDLGTLAETLKLGKKGDTIKKVDGMDMVAIERAGLMPAYRHYLRGDLINGAGIYKRLEPWFPEEERIIMDLVLRCAVQPMFHGDIKLLTEHLEKLRAHKAELLRSCGYEKAALMSTAQFQKALEDLGVPIEFKTSPTGRRVPAFAKTDAYMANLQEYSDADYETNLRVQTLAAARLAHKSTIEETRAEKFLRISSLPWGNGSGLLPVALRYGGAHTHRLSGEWGLNMQNLPRELQNLARKKEMSQLRRSLMAPPGHKVVAADLSQIEARLVALVCGELELLEQFRCGKDVYALFATKVFQRAVTDKKSPERFVGKTGILGLGYGCGVDRFFAMVTMQARQYGIDLSALEFDRYKAQATIDTYRGTYHRIRNTWHRLDLFLHSILFSRNTTQKAVLGPVTIRSAEIELPNGMRLLYNYNESKLYGALLLENIVQALARIVVMQAAVRISARGYRFALQAHDELVYLIPEAEVEDAKNIILEEMTRVPTWAPELPLAAELGVGDNYGSAKS